MSIPLKLSRLLFGIRQVKDVAVVGVPDQRLGEVAMAFIQLRGVVKSALRMR